MTSKTDKDEVWERLNRTEPTEEERLAALAKKISDIADQIDHNKVQAIVDQNTKDTSKKV